MVPEVEQLIIFCFVVPLQQRQSGTPDRWGPCNWLHDASVCGCSRRSVQSGLVTLVMRGHRPLSHRRDIRWFVLRLFGKLYGPSAHESHTCTVCRVLCEQPFPSRSIQSGVHWVILPWSLQVTLRGCTPGSGLSVVFLRRRLLGLYEVSASGFPFACMKFLHLFLVHGYVVDEFASGPALCWIRPCVDVAHAMKPIRVDLCRHCLRRIVPGSWLPSRSSSK